MSEADAPPLISLQQASMQFGGQRVLHAVDFDAVPRPDAGRHRRKWWP